MAMGLQEARNREGKWLKVAGRLNAFGGVS